MKLQIGKAIINKIAKKINSMSTVEDMLAIAKETANVEELIVDMAFNYYNKNIKQVTKALNNISEQDIQKAHDNIMKVEHIIEEFQSTLNHKYPVAKDFNEVYNYLMMRLQEANMKKDKEIMEEVLKHLRTMRDTWKQVMKLAHTQQ